MKFETERLQWEQTIFLKRYKVKLLPRILADQDLEPEVYFFWSNQETYVSVSDVPVGLLTWGRPITCQIKIGRPRKRRWGDGWGDGWGGVNIDRSSSIGRIWAPRGEPSHYGHNWRLLRTKELVIPSACICVNNTCLVLIYIEDWFLAPFKKPAPSHQRNHQHRYPDPHQT